MMNKKMGAEAWGAAELGSAAPMGAAAMGGGESGGADVFPYQLIGNGGLPEEFTTFENYYKFTTPTIANELREPEIKAVFGPTSYVLPVQIVEDKAYYGNKLENGFVIESVFNAKAGNWQIAIQTTADGQYSLAVFTQNEIERS